MTQQGVQLTYIGPQYRVRIEFTLKAVHCYPEPPAALFAKAAKKLEAEKAKGNLGFYRMFKKRLIKMWALLRQEAEMDHLPPDTKVAVTLATGGPDVPEILVTKVVGHERVIGELTITKNTPLRGMRFPLFKLIVGHKLRSLGQTVFPDPGRLYGAWYQAKNGLVVKGFKLFAIPDFSQIKTKQPYRVMLNHDYGGIELVVFNLQATMALGLDKVIMDIRHEARAIAIQTGVFYRVLKNRIEADLQSACRGPERFGIDMPMVMLAAAIKPEILQAQAQKASGEPPAPKPVPGPARPAMPLPAHTALTPAELAALVSLDITDDGMLAVVGHIDASVKGLTALQDVATWHKILALKGVTKGIDASALQTITHKLAQRQDVADTEVARGQLPRAAREPYFYEMYRENQNPEDRDKAFWERESHLTVKAGAVVGEFRFATEPKVGWNIFGAFIDPDIPDLPFVEEGPGIRLNHLGQYVATIDGMPKWIDDCLTVSEYLIIPGDLTAMAGQVHFHGSAEVRGDIDAGAHIEVSGDLLVTGMITGGQIKVGGNLIVQGGVVGNGPYAVYVRHDMYCHHIEHFFVEVLGSLQVKKCIIGGQITVFDSLTVTAEDGLVSGGVIHCWDTMKVKRLTAPAGGSTKVYLGTDPINSRRLALRSQRLANLKQAVVEWQLRDKGFRERPVRWQQLNKDKINDFRRRFAHLRRVVHQAEEAVAVVMNHRRHNPGCRLEILEGLGARVSIEMCGKSWTRPIEVARTKLVMHHGKQIRLVSMDDEQSLADVS